MSLLLSFKEIIENNLKLNQKKILLHISGGSDSMFLLYAMTHHFKNIVRDIYVITIDFGLREEAKKETSWVYEMSLKWGVTRCFIESLTLDTTKSIQKEAREKRLYCSQKIVDEYHIDYIFIAHHLDDFLETMFLKMLRAGSPYSLSQFSFQNNQFIRPLIYFSKEEILSFLEEKKIIYFTDQSNLSNHYQRNYLRLEVFPKMDEEFPNWRKNFFESFLFIQSSQNLLSFFWKKNRLYQTIPKGFFLSNTYYYLPNSHKEMILHTLFSHLFSTLPFSKKQIKEIARQINQKKDFQIKSGLYFESSCIRHVDENQFYQVLVQNQILDTPHFSCKYSLIYPYLKQKKNNSQDTVNQYFFSSTTPLNSITLRNRKEGDRIYFEQVGNKKLKEIFRENKLPHSVRHYSCLVEVEGIIKILFFLPRNYIFFLKKKKLTSLTKLSIKTSNLSSLKDPYHYCLEINWKSHRQKYISMCE